MKNILLTSILLFSLHSFALAQNSQEQILTDLVNEFLSKVDSREMHDRFWDEELIYTSGAGQRHGKNKIMAGFSAETRNTSGNKTTYTAEEMKVRVYGETAVVTFKLVAQNPDGTTLAYLNSGTFLNRKDTWKVINWQATKAANE
jgi:ketosteroid isomerase-like protein